MSDSERESIAKRHGKPPIELIVAIDAIGIYVFRDNPVRSLSMEELERIYASEPRSGPRIERWGDVGADGAWSSRPVVPFGYERDRGAHEVMRELLLGDGAFRNDVTTEPVSTSVVQAIAMEPGSVGYASIYFRTARTRLVPVRTRKSGVVLPTEETIAAGTYALARPLYFYVNSAARVATQEFMRFVQSDRGRRILKNTGGITPAR